MTFTVNYMSGYIHSTSTQTDILHKCHSQGLMHILLCKYNFFYFFSPNVDRHLGHFSVLAISNSTTLNYLICIFGGIYVSVSVSTTHMKSRNCWALEYVLDFSV